jgi:hypothetical protein
MLTTDRPHTNRSIHITMTTNSNLIFVVPFRRWRRCCLATAFVSVGWWALVVRGHNQVRRPEMVSENIHIHRANRIPKLSNVPLQVLAQPLAGQQLQRFHRHLHAESLDNRENELVGTDDVVMENEANEYMEEVTDMFEELFSDDATTSSTTDDTEFAEELFGPITDDVINANSTMTDDELMEELLEGEFDPMTDNAISNNNLTTIAEIGDFVDEMFGILENENSVNSTTGEGVLQIIDETFGIPTDDTVNTELISESNETIAAVTIETPVLTSTNESPDAKSATVIVENEVTPEPANSTDVASGMIDEDDDDDTPKAPLIRSATPTPSKSPTVLPHPLLVPTESPTMPQPESTDEKDGETEHDVDDDLFNQELYKSRPVGSIPNSASLTAILGTLAAIAAMIFTAWQMSDNPDGIFASLCRLILTCVQLVIRVVMSPCRKYLPCCYSYRGHMAGTNGYHEPYGHIPVSTMDYGYKDPALELT